MLILSHYLPMTLLNLITRILIMSLYILSTRLKSLKYLIPVTPSLLGIRNTKVELSEATTNQGHKILQRKTVILDGLPTLLQAICKNHLVQEFCHHCSLLKLQESPHEKSLSNHAISLDATLSKSTPLRLGLKG